MFIDENEYARRRKLKGTSMDSRLSGWRREYDKHGYDQQGYDCFGYDKRGYDYYGFDRSGRDRRGRTAAQLVVPPPYRDIDIETIPTGLKNKFPRHYSSYRVVDPDRLRYRYLGGESNDYLLFVEGKKGWEPATSLSCIGSGQRHFAFARLKGTQGSGGGGGFASAATTKSASEVEFSPDPQPSVRIDTPADRDTIKLLEEKASATINLRGQTYAAQRLTVNWRNEETGKAGSFEQEMANTFGRSDWSGQIPEAAPGSYTVTAEAFHGQNLSRAEARFSLKNELSVAEILYATNDRTFYLLSKADLDELEAAAGPLDETILSLENAYRSKDAQQIASAKAQLDQTLVPLVNGAAESTELLEFVRFRGRKYTYVDSRKMKNHWRSYKLEAGNRRRVLKGVGENKYFDFEELKKTLRQPKVEYSWDLVEPYHTTLGDWARSMNRSLEETFAFEDTDPERRFDRQRQAQLMRYTHGASLKGSLNAAERTFGLNAQADVTLALAEARVDLNGYWPRAAGHPLQFGYTVQRGPLAGQRKEFDCGHVRLKAQAAITGFAGASLQVSADVHFELKDGKVLMRGATKNDKVKKGANDEAVQAQAEAFAGLRGGAELTGSAEWQNPEETHDWKAFAEIGYKGTVAAGAGGKADFYIIYYQGKFIIRAEAYAVWGFGGGGGFLFTINADTIAEFCMFVYHQLKNKDFNFLEFMSSRAFEYFDTLRSYVLLVGEKMEAAYEEGEEHLKNMTLAVQSAIRKLQDVQNNRQAAQDKAQRIVDNPDLVLFLPPEGKGRLIRALCVRQWPAPLKAELQEDAIIAILKTLQTHNEYKEVMEHLTFDGSRIAPGNDAWRQGEKIIDKFLNGAQDLEFRKLREFFKRTMFLPMTPRIHTAAVRDNGILIA